MTSKNPMEPYIFSPGVLGQFTGLSGETKFPHLKMGSGWAGSPLGPQFQSNMPASARLQLTALLSGGW